MAVKEIEADFSSFLWVFADAFSGLLLLSVVPFLLTPLTVVSTSTRVRVDVDPAPPPRLTVVELSSPGRDRDSVVGIDGVSDAVDKEFSNEADDFPCWTALTRALFPAMTVDDGRVVLLIE